MYGGHAALEQQTMASIICLLVSSTYSHASVPFDLHGSSVNHPPGGTLTSGSPPTGRKRKRTLHSSPPATLHLTSLQRRLVLRTHFIRNALLHSECGATASPTLLLPPSPQARNTSADVSDSDDLSNLSNREDEEIADAIALCGSCFPLSHELSFAHI